MTLAESLTRFSLRWPGATLGGVALLTVVLGLGIPRIQRETSLRTFLGPDHPTVVTLDRHVERFGGGYPVIIAFSCDESPCESIFDDEALAVASDVARRLERTPGVRAVHGPANTAVLRAAGEDLVARRLVDDDGAGPPTDRAALVAAALMDPLWQRALVSDHGRVGALVVDVASTAGEVQGPIAGAIESALEPHRERGWSFNLVGELVDFVYSGPDLERASQAMVPVMTGVLIVVLLVLLRSVALSVVVVATMGIAFAWTQGAMGWAGIQLNALTTVTPSIVFAIGILDGVHVVSHFSRHTWQEGDLGGSARRKALVSTAGDVGRACLLTSLTTIGAFLAFLASGIASFGEFALAAAWGIACAFLLTFTVLPVLLSKLPAAWLGLPRAQPAWEGFFESLLTVVHRRSGEIVVIALLLTAIGLAGVAQVRVEIHPEQLIGETSQVMVWNRWLRRHLRETETLELALALPPGRSFREPAVLDQLDEITGFLSGRDRLRAPRSVLDGLRHLNRALHRGDEVFYRVEDTRAANAQLAMLLSINDPTLLDQWVFTRVDEDGGSSEVLRVAAEAESMDTRTQQALLDEVRTYLDASLPSDWSYELTGSVPMYLDMMVALQRYQIICFGVAGLAVFGLMAVFLRSARASTIALLPSVAPIVVTLGLLGWWGYGLDPGSTMVATIVLGVAVDDGIHLLSHYRRERELGAPVEDATDEAVRHVGTAVVVSSIVLAAAFWSLTTSPTSSVATFGFLAGIAITAALVADLLLLPALLLRRTLGDPFARAPVREAGGGSSTGAGT